MHNIRDPLRTLIFFALLLSWPHTTSAAGVNVRPDPLSIIQVSTGANRSDTTFTASVPPDFEVVALTRRGWAMPDLTTLNLALLVMSKVAELNWDALTGPTTESLEGVTLATSLHGTPPGTRGIRVRYVIWGIYRAVQDLMRSGITWLQPLYELRWQGQVVGSLVFYYKTKPTERVTLPNNDEEKNHSSHQLRQDHSSISPPPASNGRLPAISPQNSPADLADDGLEILIYYADEHTPVLGEYDVYINMLAMIVHGARGPSTATIVQDYGLSVTGFDARITVTGAKDTPKPVSRPPLFTWHVLFLGMRSTSRELWQTRTFRSFRVKLQINGVEVGNILMDPWGGPSP
ncbi:MAG: hypothetical protein Q9208_003885 [Pyrenodesmia sp. 3 TL-2023]